jgi:pyruvate formate lyase activating enzyme
MSHPSRQDRKTPARSKLTCKYCQNWQFSQKSPYETENYQITPEEVVRRAYDANCGTIAFFYTEPVIYFEYMVDIAKRARQNGIRTVMVSAGYINEEPLKEILPIIDAVTFGFKGFTEKYYTDVIGGELEHVLHTLQILEKSHVWYEMVNLIVPTLNDDLDDIRRMCEWIKANLAITRPLHFTRFVPEYQLRNLPITPQRTLEQARAIALHSGLSYVYTGNMPGHEGSNTYCPACKKVLIQRVGIKMKKNIVQNNRCPYCGAIQLGRWV